MICDVWNARRVHRGVLVFAALGGISACGDDPQEVIEDCDTQDIVVPNNGICDIAEMSPESGDDFRLCLEYTGARFQESTKVDCTARGGIFYDDRDCTEGGSVGSCIVEKGAREEKRFYYYVPRWNDSRARSHCSAAVGEFSEPAPEAAELCAARCGNGEVETPGEACDDGNQVSGDGCSATCELE